MEVYIYFFLQCMLCLATRFGFCTVTQVSDYVFALICTFENMRLHAAVALVARFPAMVQSQKIVQVGTCFACFLKEKEQELLPV